MDVGAECFDISRLPGHLDLIVAWRGRLTWLEIKQPGLQDDLTPMEKTIIARLQRVAAPVAVVTTSMEALKAIGAIV